MPRRTRGDVAGLDPDELDIVGPCRRSAQTYALMREQVVPAMAAITRVLTP